MIWWSTGAFYWGFRSKIRSTARSPAKKQWCCTTKKMGCEGSSPPSVDPGVGMMWKHVQATDSERFWKTRFHLDGSGTFLKNIAAQVFLSVAGSDGKWPFKKPSNQNAGCTHTHIHTDRQACVKMMYVSACHVTPSQSCIQLISR